MNSLFFFSIYLFYFIFILFLFTSVILGGSKNKGSMDPVHGAGPWTRGPCFVLSQFSHPTVKFCSNSSQREDDFNQQERKKLSERRPTFNNLRSQVKELAQDYSFSEVGRRSGCSFKNC